MRSFIAFTLLIVAVVLGFGGMGAHWTDRLARTPAPMQRILGPLAGNEQVVAALKETLAAETKRALPAGLRDMPVLGEQIDGVIVAAVDATLADPGVLRAWNESINRSRVAYVAALDSLRGDEALESPTLWFNLTPFAELGATKLLEVAPEAFHPHLSQLQVTELRLPLGQPPASLSKSIADGVGAARNWPYFYVGAALFAVGGLATGTRRGRWIALALAGVFAAVGLWFGRSVVETVGFPAGDSLAAVIRTSIVSGGTQSFLEFTQPALYVAYGAVAVGLLGVLIASQVTRK